MRFRNLSFVTTAAVALAMLAASSAQAQTFWTCQKFTDSGKLGAKFQMLAPDAQLSAKIVVRQFQSVAQLKAAPTSEEVSVDSEDATSAAKKQPIPGAKLGHMIFIDDYNLLLENGSTSTYTPFASPGAVAQALNDMPVGEADDAKVVIEQFTAQQKHQKATPGGQLRLINQYIMFYLAPFAEAQSNACGTVTEPSPTPTSTSAPTPTQAPTAIATGMGVGTPTPTAMPTATALATLIATATQASTPQPTPPPAVTPTATPAQAAPTPTQPCETFGGQACGPTPTPPTFSSPTPTAACVQFGGLPCGPASPTPTFAMPTPTRSCVEFGGQPCPTPTPAS